MKANGRMTNDKWPRVPLSEVFAIARGGSPRPIDKFLTDDPNGVNWIMISDASDSSKYIRSTKKRIVNEGVSRSRMVKPGDFLLTNSMSFGRPYIMQTSGCIHDGWLVLSPREQNVSPDFFYHLLGSRFIFAEFERLAAGATVKNLNIELVKGVQIPMPPLAEQRRIAEVLDQAESLRAKRRATLSQLDSLTQSIFLDFFGDPVTNPNGWVSDSLGEISQRITDGEHLNPTFSSSGMPMIMASNVLDDHIDFENARTVDLTLGKRFRKKCDPEIGDLLLVSRGATIGRQCVVSIDREFCLMGSVILIKPDRNIVEPRFLSALLRFPSLQSALYKTSGSSAQQAIYLKDLRNLACMLPPLDLQREFVQTICAVEKVKILHRNSLVEMDALFASLQSRAFCGEL